MQDMWKGVFVSVGPQTPQQESQQGATIRFCCVFNRPGVSLLRGIRLGKQNTSSSSNPNYLFFGMASIPRSDMEKLKLKAANKFLYLCYLQGFF